MNKSRIYYLNSLIGIAIMLGFRYLPLPLPEITDTGMEVLGIFLGAIYLWATVDVVWPSALAVFLLGMSHYADMGTVLKEAFGNPLVVQVFWLMVVLNSLRVFGITEHVGHFLITRKFMIGRPWVFSGVFFFSSMLIAAFLDTYTPLFLFWPILYSIFKELNMKPYEKYPTIMIILVLVGTMLGYPVPPYTGGALILISNFNTIAPNFFSYEVSLNNLLWMAIALAVAVITGIIILLFAKYVLRPDTSKLKNLTLEQLQKNELPPLTTEQKIVSAIVALFIISLLLPSVFQSTAFAKILKDNAYGMSLFFIVLLLLVRSKGSPITGIGKLFQGFSWESYMIMVAAMLMGSAVTSENTGVTSMLSTILGPAFDRLSPVMFCVLIMIVAWIITNICNSLATGAIIQTIICTYCAQQGITDPAAIITIGSITALSTAIMSPAASPFAVFVFSNKEWLRTRDTYKYTITFSIIMFLLLLAVGLPLTLLILG